MTNSKPYQRYTEEFKRTLVNLHANGKSQSALCREYGVGQSALAKWIRSYSEVKIDSDTVMTAQQIKELQKRNAMLEEENLILKKAIAIFTPRSNKD
jgi:transposase